MNELSENVVVMPVNTPPFRNGVAPGPVAVTVGFRPQGIAVSPVPIGGKQLAYVANILSRSVSVLDVTSNASPFEVHRISVTPTTPEPRSRRRDRWSGTGTAMSEAARRAAPRSCISAPSGRANDRRPSYLKA